MALFLEATAYDGGMRTTILAATVATLMFTASAFAEPQPASLDGAVQGTLTSPARGSVEVVSKGGYQLVKFNDQFAVSSHPEAEVRLVDASTGKVILLGYLKKDGGSQTYRVPGSVTLTAEDQVVIYSPSLDEDVAAVGFDQE